jgi:ribosomal protein S18 acetylase RimI-like enzyme
MRIRHGDRQDDEILARHHIALWKSYGIPVEQMRADALAIILDFIAVGRRERNLATFLACADDDRVVGSASCQLHRVPYPEIMLPSVRRFGYVWSVFVEPAYRRQGIARQLMEHALAHLRSIGCTTAVLHSSDAGEALYQQLGFRVVKEMRMGLNEPPPGPADPPPGPASGMPAPG